MKPQLAATPTEPGFAMPDSRGIETPGRVAARRAGWRLVRHYIEMLLSMWVGMVLLSGPLTRATAAWSGSTSAVAWIEWVTMPLAMSIGMAVLMACRGHRVRHIGLMTAAMFAPSLVGGTLVETGAVARNPASLLSHVAMLVVMLLLMCANPAAYNGPHHTRPVLRRVVHHVVVVVVAMAVPVLIAAGGLAHRSATAYTPSPNDTVLPSPAPAPHDANKPTVAVVLGADGAEVGDVLGPYQTLATQGRLNVYTVAEGHGAITLTGGLDLVPDLTFDGLSERLGAEATPDVVVVPAMPEPGSPGEDAVVGWLRRQHAAGATVLGVCNGARILAESGLLDHRPATSHWLRLDGLRQAYPEVQWKEGTRYVDDGDIITTAGILSGIDGSLRVIERLFGTDEAARTAREIDWRHFSPGQPGTVPGSNLGPRDAVAALNAGFHWNRTTLGVLLTDGVSELELASVFDPYAGQSLAVDTVAVATTPFVRTRHDLTLVPRATLVGAAPHLDRLLVPGREASRRRAAVDAAAQEAGITPEYLHTQPGFPLEAGLRDLAATVNVPTARWAAKMLEYPIDEETLEGRGWPWPLTAIPLVMCLGTIGLLRLGVVGWQRLRSVVGSRPGAVGG